LKRKRNHKRDFAMKERKVIKFKLLPLAGTNLVVKALLVTSAEECTEITERCLKVLDLSLKSENLEGTKNILDDYLEALENHTKDLQQLKKDLLQNIKKGTKKASKKK
tara:strand:- start:9538 stop:9861 length:324 start_codon:yes stop_codon:yes gene_type:complete